MQKTEKLFLAVLVAVMAAIGLILLVVLASGNEGKKEGEPAPTNTFGYRDMVYVKDTFYLYISRSASLPEGYTQIGNILRVISASEGPFENFTSTVLPADSEIYYNESLPEVIYAKLTIEYDVTVYSRFATFEYVNRMALVPADAQCAPLLRRNI